MKLPPRERQVAHMLMEGCNNREIAARLGITLSTLRTHVHKMFLRFGVSGPHGRATLLAKLSAGNIKKGS